MSTLWQEEVFASEQICSRESLTKKAADIEKMISLKIPAKKWGDTEIAERGRSVLLMRARYRSAGLTLHQRGWTDAG